MSTGAYRPTIGTEFMERDEGCRGTKPLFVVESGSLRCVKLLGEGTSLSEVVASLLRKNFILRRFPVPEGESSSLKY